MTLLKKMVSNKFFLKIASCTIGFSWWYFLSSFHTVTLNRTLPVSFYGEDAENYSVEATESVTVALHGKKKDFYNLDLANLAIHINADLLHKGKNVFALTQENLFLPGEIKLIHYNPSNVVVVKKS